MRGGPVGNHHVFHREILCFVVKCLFCGLPSLGEISKMVFKVLSFYLDDHLFDRVDLLIVVFLCEGRRERWYNALAMRFPLYIALYNFWKWLMCSSIYIRVWHSGANQAADCIMVVRLFMVQSMSLCVFNLVFNLIFSFTKPWNVLWYNWRALGGLDWMVLWY